MNQERIGKFIKQIRQDNNLTQKDLADKLGVTYQAVSKWENGKNAPDIATLKEISKEFNINIDEILEGRKTLKKKYNIILIAIILILLIGLLTTTILLIKSKNSNNFEFKTISSKCEDFKISGSAAYNKEKATIYISNVEFCGENENIEYKEINCVLYETYNDTRTKISSCEEKKNSNLEDYLKGVNINVDNFTSNCKQLTSSNLSLEIEALTKDNKTVTYKIPIKLNDTCKK